MKGLKSLFRPSDEPDKLTNPFADSIEKVLTDESGVNRTLSVRGTAKPVGLSKTGGIAGMSLVLDLIGIGNADPWADYMTDLRIVIRMYLATTPDGRGYSSLRQLLTAENVRVLPGHSDMTSDRLKKITWIATKIPFDFLQAYVSAENSVGNAMLYDALYENYLLLSTTSERRMLDRPAHFLAKLEITRRRAGGYSQDELAMRCKRALLSCAHKQAVIKYTSHAINATRSIFTQDLFSDSARDDWFKAHPGQKDNRHSRCAFVRHACSAAAARLAETLEFTLVVLWARARDAKLEGSMPKSVRVAGLCLADDRFSTKVQEIDLARSVILIVDTSHHLGNDVYQQLAGAVIVSVDRIVADLGGETDGRKYGYYLKGAGPDNRGQLWLQESVDVVSAGHKATYEHGLKHFTARDDSIVHMRAMDEGEQNETNRIRHVGLYPKGETQLARLKHNLLGGCFGHGRFRGNELNDLYLVRSIKRTGRQTGVFECQRHSISPMRGMSLTILCPSYHHTIPLDLADAARAAELNLANERTCLTTTGSRGPLILDKCVRNTYPTVMAEDRYETFEFGGGYGIKMIINDEVHICDGTGVGGVYFKLPKDVYMACVSKAGASGNAFNAKNIQLICAAHTRYDGEFTPASEESNDSVARLIKASLLCSLPESTYACERPPTVVLHESAEATKPELGGGTDSAYPNSALPGVQLWGPIMTPNLAVKVGCNAEITNSSTQRLEKPRTLQKGKPGSYPGWSKYHKGSDENGSAKARRKRWQECVAGLTEAECMHNECAIAKLEKLATSYRSTLRSKFKRHNGQFLRLTIEEALDKLLEAKNDPVRRRQIEEFKTAWDTLRLTSDGNIMTAPALEPRAEDETDQSWSSRRRIYFATLDSFLSEDVKLQIKPEGQTASQAARMIMPADFISIVYTATFVMPFVDGMKNHEVFPWYAPGATPDEMAELVRKTAHSFNKHNKDTFRLPDSCDVSKMDATFMHAVRQMITEILVDCCESENKAISATDRSVIRRLMHQEIDRKLKHYSREGDMGTQYEQLLSEARNLSGFYTTTMINTICVSFFKYSARMLRAADTSLPRGSFVERSYMSNGPSPRESDMRPNPEFYGDRVTVDNLSRVCADTACCHEIMDSLGVCFGDDSLCIWMQDIVDLCMAWFGIKITGFSPTAEDVNFTEFLSRFFFGLEGDGPVSSTPLLVRNLKNLAFTTKSLRTGHEAEDFNRLTLTKTMGFRAAEGHAPPTANAVVRAVERVTLGYDAESAITTRMWHESDRNGNYGFYTYVQSGQTMRLDVTDREDAYKANLAGTQPFNDCHLMDAIGADAFSMRDTDYDEESLEQFRMACYAIADEPDDTVAKGLFEALERDFRCEDPPQEYGAEYVGAYQGRDTSRPTTAGN